MSSAVQVSLSVAQCCPSSLHRNACVQLGIVQIIIIITITVILIGHGHDGEGRARARQTDRRCLAITIMCIHHSVSWVGMLMGLVKVNNIILITIIVTLTIKEITVLIKTIIISILNIFLHFLATPSTAPESTILLLIQHHLNLFLDAIGWGALSVSSVVKVVSLTAHKVSRGKIFAHWSADRQRVFLWPLNRFW